MLKRVLTLILSAGITAGVLYASLGPRDYHRGYHHHHHHHCDDAME